MAGSTSTASATRGNCIIVGDLMKSITLLTYNPAEKQIDEVAKDFDANWYVTRTKNVHAHVEQLS